MEWMRTGINKSLWTAAFAGTDLVIQAKNT
jgi:hypothetical protein